MEASAGVFTEDDSIHMLNFALSISPEHLAAVRTFHVHFVNPQALRIEPCLMGWLSAMPRRCPLARVAVLCRACMVDPKHYVRCGHLYVARGITESQVKAVSPDDEAANLAHIEGLLGRLARTVEPSTSNGAALKAVCGIAEPGGPADPPSQAELGG